MKLRLTIFLAMLSVLSVFPMDVFVASFEDLSDSFGIPFDSSIDSVSWFTYGFGIGVLIVGFIAEKVGATRTVLYALFSLLITNVLSVYSESYNIFLFCRFLQGFFSSAFVLSTFFIRNGFKEEEGVKVRAQVMSVSAIAITLSPMLGAHLTLMFGWTSVIATASVFCILTIFSFFSIKRKFDNSPQNKSCIENNFAKSRAFWVNNFISTVNFSIHFVFVMISVKIFTVDFGKSLEEYGVMMLIYGASLFFTNYFIVKMRDRMNFLNSESIYLSVIFLMGFLVYLINGKDFYFYFPLIIIAMFFSVYMTNVSINKAIFSVNGTPLVSSVIGSVRFVTAGTIGWICFNLKSGMTSFAFLCMISAILSILIIKFEKNAEKDSS